MFLRPMQVPPPTPPPLFFSLSPLKRKNVLGCHAEATEKRSQSFSRDLRKLLRRASLFKGDDICEKEEKEKDKIQKRKKRACTL